MSQFRWIASYDSELKIKKILHVYGIPARYLILRRILRQFVTLWLPMVSQHMIAALFFVFTDAILKCHCSQHVSHDIFLLSFPMLSEPTWIWLISICPVYKKGEKSVPIIYRRSKCLQENCCYQETVDLVTKHPLPIYFMCHSLPCAFINWIVWFFTNFRWRNWRKNGEHSFFYWIFCSLSIFKLLTKRLLHFDQSYTMYKLFFLANFAFIRFLFKLWCFGSGIKPSSKLEIERIPCQASAKWPPTIENGKNSSRKTSS